MADSHDSEYTSEIFEQLVGMITLIHRIPPFFCYICSTNLQSGMNIYLFVVTWVLTGALCKNEHQIYHSPPPMARNDVTLTLCLAAEVCSFEHFRVLQSSGTTVSQRSVTTHLTNFF